MIRAAAAGLAVRPAVRCAALAVVLQLIAAAPTPQQVQEAEHARAVLLEQKKAAEARAAALAAQQQLLTTQRIEAAARLRALEDQTAEAADRVAGLARRRQAAEAALHTASADLEAFVDRHRDVSTYALDTEFEHRTTYRPRLALLQVCCDDEVALVDPLRVDSSPLRVLLDSSATAVLHAAVNDLDLISAAVGVAPRHLLDTEIGGQLLGRPRTSLAAMVRDYLGIRLDKAEQTRDWMRRPLPERALRYAADDVAYLVELAERLDEDLTSCGRGEAWREESTAVLHDTADDTPSLWWRVKGLLRAPEEVRLRGQYLCGARDDVARERDLGRGRVLNDDDLVEIAFRPEILGSHDVARDDDLTEALEVALRRARQASLADLWPADADVTDGDRGRRLRRLR
ncbi:MAG: hypothetical protein B7W95_00660, partial [Acidimicrobiales bacterium 20-64-4]